MSAVAAQRTSVGAVDVAQVPRRSLARCSAIPLFVSAIRLYCISHWVVAARAVLCGAHGTERSRMSRGWGGHRGVW